MVSEYNHQEAPQPGAYASAGWSSNGWRYEASWLTIMPPVYPRLKPSWLRCWCAFPNPIS